MCCSWLHVPLPGMPALGFPKLVLVWSQFLWLPGVFVHTYVLFDICKCTLVRCTATDPMMSKERKV